jgi:hypothetical protein
LLILPYEVVNVTDEQQRNHKDKKEDCVE